MKIFLFLASILLAGVASADSKVEVRVNRIDMAVAAPDDPGDTNGGDAANAGTRAQDYNSSRSNTTSLRDQDENIDRPVSSGGKAQDYNSSRSNNSSVVAPAPNNTKDRFIDPDDDGDGIDTAVCGNGVDDDCDGPVDAAPANHNTTRSNKTSP